MKIASEWLLEMLAGELQALNKDRYFTWNGIGTLGLDGADNIVF